MKNNRGFTLIEMLLAVGIVAVLAIVAIYLLNPSQLLIQARDGNRIEAMGVLDKAISLYYSSAMDNPATLFMGTSSVMYLSIPDPTATTTAGTDCSGLGFVSTPSTTYHCAASSTYLKVDGTGWIPINFTSNPGGSPIASLSVDPINTTSSGEYYAYASDGTGGYELIADPQATKDIPDTADFMRGTNLALLPPFPNTITFTTSTYRVGSTPAGIAFDPNTNSVWVLNRVSNNVTQINDITYVTSTYGIATNSYAITFDSHTNTIWVANDVAAGTVTQLNDTTYVTSTYPVGTNPFGIAFDSNTNTIWVANDSFPASVTRLNDTTYTTSTYVIGANPIAMAVAFDSHTNTIWATNFNAGTVTQINDTTYVTSTYAVGNPGAVAFDSHTNTIWVVNGSSNTVTQINDTTYAESTYPVGTNPDAVVFDSHTDSVWVLNYGAGTVTQINDTTHAESTYTVGITPFGMGFDSHTNTIWVTNSFDNTVTQFIPSR